MGIVIVNELNFCKRTKFVSKRWCRSEKKRTVKNNLDRPEKYKKGSVFKKERKKTKTNDLNSIERA